MTEDGTTLPPSLRRLWGLDVQKAPRTALTVERVVQAAIEVADAEGLDAVSMSRVAKQLGFTTMALYRHVESKDELLELMVDVASGEPPELPADNWRAALEQWTWAQFRRAQQRLWMTQVAAGGIPTGPHRIAWMEAGLRALRDTALDGAERLGVIQLFSSYALSQAVFFREMAIELHRAGQNEAEMIHAFGRNMAAVLDPERHAELSKLVAGGLFESQALTDPGGPDGDFAFGLDRILDGVEMLLRERAAGRA